MLVDPRRQLVKLTGFMIARLADPVPDAAYTQKVVSAWYRPPEMLLGARLYSAEVDTWCVEASFIKPSVLGSWITAMRGAGRNTERGKRRRAHYPGP